MSQVQTIGEKVRVRYLIFDMLVDFRMEVEVQEEMSRSTEAGVDRELENGSAEDPVSVSRMILVSGKSLKGSTGR